VNKSAISVSFFLSGLGSELVRQLFLFLSVLSGLCWFLKRFRASEMWVAARSYILFQFCGGKNPGG
jgi:hypothetical protein